MCLMAWGGRGGLQGDGARGGGGAEVGGSGRKQAGGKRDRGQGSERCLFCEPSPRLAEPCRCVLAGYEKGYGNGGAQSCKRNNGLGVR